MRLLTLYHLHEKITECEMDQQKDITIGREKECSITIDDSLISRKHVRIFWESETWNVQCLSRFTQLKSGDGEMLSNLTVPEDTDCEFWMANYRIHISSPLNQEMQQPEAVPHVLPSTSTALLDPKDLDANESQDQLDTPLENHLESFSSHEAADEIADEVENQNENTSLMNIENEPPGQLEEQDHEKTQFADQGLHSANLEARLKVIKKGGIEDVFVLKGDRWVIGRGEDCEVFLDHPKVSRLHFELNCIQGEYSIKDLKSSNGTYLNGQKVSHLQAELLQSGDRINIEDVIICFEICNVELEKQLQVIATNQEDPIQSMQGVNQQSVHLPSEISPQPPQGAIRIPSPIKSRKKGNGKKKFVRVALFGMLAILFYALMNESPQDKEPKVAQDQSSKEGTGFDSLTPEQKILVVNSYRSAEMMFEQKQYDLVVGEIQKIHQILPSGFENSKSIEKHAQTAIESLRQEAELMAQAERQRQLIAEVERIINSCREKFKNSIDVEGLQSCLEAAIERDPENPQIPILMEKINQRLAKHNRKNREKNRYLARVKSGKKLYEQAKALQDQKQWLDAIDAYQVHIDSSYPDPENLKEKSQKYMERIDKAIKRKIASYQSMADDKVKAKDYKNAILFLRKSLDLDPTQSPPKRQITEYSEKLASQMKVLYADSVLEESLGNIEVAKKKWKAIMATDIRDGQYYKKAKVKLKKYEI